VEETMRVLRAKRSLSNSLVLLLALAGSTLTLPSICHAATLTVCASGCNYTTIAAAIAAASPGDTISIQDAVHSEANITVDRDLTIQGQGAANTAVDGGGGGTIFTIDSGITVAIQNITVRNGSSSADGGGIVNSGTLTISNSTLSGNFSSSNGGGLANFSGAVTISNSTVSNNTADAFGGGILNSSGTITISNSTLASNFATSDGGGLAVISGTVAISSSTLSDNTASTFAGGGIWNFSGSISVINSTFSGNAAPNGGGIYNQGQVTISSSTLAGNVVSTGGGGIDNLSSATVKNSIVGDNSGGDCSGTIAALGANLDTDGTCVSANFTQVTSAQVNLGLLALNPPGSTETQALLPGSVAINAVSDCTDVAGNPVTADQRGVTRPQGPACDIGSFEAQTQPTSAVSTHTDLGLLTDSNDTPTGANVTMGAFVHDQAMVTTTVNPIPTGSSVSFTVFPDATCSSTASSSDTVSLTGGAMAESVESSGTTGVAAYGPLSVGAIAYEAVFNSGDTTQVPNSTSTCEPLNIGSPISQFFYYLDGNTTTSYNCTLESLVNNTCTTGQEATVSMLLGSTHSFQVNVQVANQTGLPVIEKVAGGLTAGKDVLYSGLTTTCGSAMVKHNGQVTWNANGAASPKAAGFQMAPAVTCELQVTVTETFSSTGQQTITSQWSATQTEVSPVTNQTITLTSPLTGSLVVDVTP
jgi:hypothetical protein